MRNSRLHGIRDYASYVEYLTITLAGHGDNSGKAIDIYLSKDAADDHADKILIASYDVAYADTFTLTMDILNSELLYNGSYVGGLLGGISPLDFIDINSGYVGYGCHFWHDSTTIDVGVNTVPIPGAALLLGSGLLSLFGFRRKYIK